MAKLKRATISKRTVEALPVGERDTVFWDRELPGFGVRIYPTGAKVYLVQTRSVGKSRRVPVGRHGLLTAERARSKAAELIAGIKAGQEPAHAGAASPSATGPTVAEVAERYMREHVAVRSKPTTERGYRDVLDRLLIPELGSLRLGEIGCARVEALHYRLHRTPATANRAVILLSRLFTMAEAWGLAPEGETRVGRVGS